MEFARLRSEPDYNTLAVVERTGEPANTFRAWERRFGFPRPAPTDGYRIINLGADLPFGDLLNAILRLRPDAVLLAASTEPVARRLSAEVAVLKGILGERFTGGRAPLLCVGGRSPTIRHFGTAPPRTIAAIMR